VEEMAVQKGPKRNVNQKRRHLLGMSTKDLSLSNELKAIILKTISILRTGKCSPQKGTSGSVTEMFSALHYAKLCQRRGVRSIHVTKPVP